MKKDLFNLTIKEFTRLLCDSEEIYTLEKKEFHPDGTINNNDYIRGTYSQIRDSLKSASIQSPNNEIIKKMLKEVEDKLFDYDIELEIIDIYNYLQYKTDKK